MKPKRQIRLLHKRQLVAACPEIGTIIESRINQTRMELDLWLDLYKNVLIKICWEMKDGT